MADRCNPHFDGLQLKGSTLGPLVGPAHILHNQCGLDIFSKALEA